MLKSCFENYLFLSLASRTLLHHPRIFRWLWIAKMQKHARHWKSSTSNRSIWRRKEEKICNESNGTWQLLSWLCFSICRRKKWSNFGHEQINAENDKWNANGTRIHERYFKFGLAMHSRIEHGNVEGSKFNELRLQHDSGVLDDLHTPKVLLELPVQPVHQLTALQHITRIPQPMPDKFVNNFLIEK